jgi:hypothetical protein
MVEATEGVVLMVTGETLAIRATLMVALGIIGVHILMTP